MKKSNEPSESTNELTEQPVSRRSSFQPFDWKSCCIGKKHPDRKKINKVGVLPFKETILKKCAERNDDWSTEVSRRLTLSIDLVASNAAYQIQCKTNFLTNKGLPGKKIDQTQVTAGSWQAFEYELSEILSQPVRMAR